MWIPTSDLRRSAGHPFYERLNRVFDDADFDAFVEAQCARFYADGVGRQSLAPWRLIDLETHTAVFTWLLQRLADAGLVKGQTLGIDATTLEANAALRSIVRRDTGESCAAFLTRLAQASGIATPTRADLARLDRKRKKKGSKDDWTHPQDPDAKSTKLKDGRTHLAHKAEQAVDLDTGAIVGVTVQPADHGDTETWAVTIIMAAEQVETVQPAADAVRDLVGDKGYHSNQVLVDLEAVGIRAYLSEPDRGRRHWRGKALARDAVYRTRRRIRGPRGPRLLRHRGERVERPFAHLYETGAMRRVHLRGHTNIIKRVLVHTGGFNLGLLMRRAGRRGHADQPPRPCGSSSRPSHGPPLLGLLPDHWSIRSIGSVVRPSRGMAS